MDKKIDGGLFRLLTENPTIKDLVSTVQSALTSAEATLASTKLPSDSKDYKKVVAPTGNPIAGTPSKRSSYTPTAESGRHFGEALEKAKSGDEKGAVASLYMMENCGDGYVPGRKLADQTRQVYGALYENSLNSALQEIAAHDPSAEGRSQRHESDPFLSKLDPKALMDRLVDYGTKAGKSPEEIKADVKQLNTALYNYYKAEAGRRVTDLHGNAGEGDYLIEHGGVTVDEAGVDKCAAKLRQLAPGAGISEDELKKDIRGMYSNLLHTRSILYNYEVSIVGFIGLPKSFPEGRDEIYAHVRSIANKGGLSEGTADAYIGGIGYNAYSTDNSSKLNMVSLKLVQVINHEEATIGRKTTMAERFALLDRFPDLARQVNEEAHRKYTPPSELELEKKTN